MEEKKDFFSLLDPKSALLVGIVGGVLSLGTIGCFVFGSLWYKSVNGGAVRTTATTAAPAPVAAAPTAPTPPPNVPKNDRPKVELFVMSYCPFGLQMQKAYLPAWDLLKARADIDVKFVSYAMHDLKEVEENTLQYCIQKDQPKTYAAYLKCFVDKGDAASCLASAGVNQSRLNSCVSATNKQFAVLDKFNDKTTWLNGRFPVYPVHAQLNDTYGVQGSPTLVINGTQAEVARTPEAIKQAICAAFNKAPAECEQTLSNNSYAPGFGMTLAGAAGATAPGCGV